MKRTPLQRRTPLKASQGLRTAPLAGAGATARAKTRPRKRRPQEPGESFWKRERWGRCSVCRRWGRIVWHHVIREHDLRALGHDPWDPDDAWPLGAPLAMGGRCHCHDNHHAHSHKLPRSKIPAPAARLLIVVFGSDAAVTDYLDRYYQ